MKENEKDTKEKKKFKFSTKEIHKNLFAKWMIDKWNKHSSHAHAVSANSINTLKKRLDKVMDSEDKWRWAVRDLE